MIINEQDMQVSQDLIYRLQNSLIIFDTQQHSYQQQH
jgi:hypothetical protein